MCVCVCVCVCAYVHVRMGVRAEAGGCWYQAVAIISYTPRTAAIMYGCGHVCVHVRLCE